MSHFSDSARFIGTAAPHAERLGRGPYTNGKDADTGTFKGKEKSLHDGPPKGFSKGFPKSFPKGPPKGPNKGKSWGKGVPPPPVFVPAANPPPPGPP